MLFYNQIKEVETTRSNVDDLLAANEKEDKLIASLKKKLGMKKKKNLPSKFAEDGLDCILESVDIHILFAYEELLFM